MYLGSKAANFAVLIARVWIGIMVFAHGWRHLKSVRSGPGMANWFESLGLKPGPVHAWNVTITELVFPFLLVAGFLTPIAYGGVCALMVVALMTNHRKNGFFLSSAKEGYEYVATVAVLAITLGHPRTGQVVARPRIRSVDPVRAEEGAGRHRGRRARGCSAVPARVLAAAEVGRLRRLISELG